MKFRYIFLLSLILCGLSACKKALDTKPKDTLAPATYYNNVEELNFALNGVYDNLGSLYGTIIHYRLGFEGDEGWYTRNSPANGPQIYDFTAGHADIKNFWNNLYSGINRANYLLISLNKNPDLDATARAQVEGEALFLRAYYYFMLVQNFGDVPLILTPAGSVDDVDVAKSSAKEVYEQIIADMTKAEAVVPSIASLGFGGRVNKSAVRGILARVCLYMAGYPVKDVSKYKDARDWAKKVIDDGEAGHVLNPSFSDVFIKLASDKYDVKESLWEVEYWGNKTDAYTETGYLGYVNGPNTTNVTTGYGYGGIRIMADLYYKYEDGDLRRDWSIAPFTYGNAAAAPYSRTYLGTATRATAYARYPGKYRREYEVVLPKNTSATPINCPLLRFSDVLLMYAEAENEMAENATPTQNAIDAVNKVRQRGWSTGIKSVALVGGSGYTTAPTLKFTGGGGSGIVATTTITNGVVTSINFANDPIYGKSRGINYTSAPTIEFIGGGGTGASATATIYKAEDANMPATATASKDAFRKFIRDERSRELNGETFRKADLIRWDIFVERMHELSTTIEKDLIGVTSPPSYLNLYIKGFGSNITDRNKLWPLPTSDITLNRKLIQNSGW